MGDCVWVSLLLVGDTAPGRPSMPASRARQQRPQEPIPRYGLCSPRGRLTARPRVSLLGGVQPAPSPALPGALHQASQSAEALELLIRLLIRLVRP